MSKNIEKSKDNLVNRNDADHIADTERFEMIMKASPDCIKLFNLKNELLYLSPGGLAEHNFKNLDEAIGFDWTESIVPEQRDEIRQKIRESVEEKKIVSLDVKHLPEFANRGWCNLIISPVFDGNGNVKYFAGISRDITNRKKSEIELERLNKAMVERELQMVELKKENAKLKEKNDK